MAALDVATAISNVRSMLGGLSAWQTICGVATSAEAIKRIHYGGVDEDKEYTAAPCIILDVTSLPTNWIAGHLRGRFAVELRFTLEVPEANRATISDQYVWVWTKFSAIMAGINGALNDAGELMVENMDVPLMPGRIDSDDNQGRTEWGFIISLGSELV